MKRLFCLLIFWAAAGSGFTLEAQQPSTGTPMGGGMRTVSGSVVVQGTLVGNVRVTIESLNRSFHRVVSADGSGSFVISGVPVGPYTITLEAEGYRTAREQLDVPPGSGLVVVQYMLVPAQPTPDPTTKGPLVSAASLQVPRDARNEFEAGLRDLERQRRKNARDHFEKALTKYAKFPQALHALALLDLEEQKSEHALEELRRALEVDGTYTEGHLALSQALNSLGRHTEALDAARRGMELRPDLWQFHYEAGVAALGLGKEDVALASSERILALAGPKIAETRLLRAGVLLRRERYAEARIELLAFLELAPQHRLASLAKQTLRDVEGKLSLAPKE